LQILIPDALRARTSDKRFWTDYLFLTEADWEGSDPPYPDLVGAHVELRFARDLGLVLELDEHMGYFSLQLRRPAKPEPEEIAWDDQAHWHPHVLRWEELDLLCRCASLHDSSVRHPGALLALLSRFTPLCEGDDVDRYLPLLEGAWRSLSVFDENEVTKLVERFDVRQGRFQWQEKDGIHTLHQPEEAERSSGFHLYTLRRPENQKFPFADLEQLVLAALGRYQEAVAPRWRTPNVLGLARSIVSEKGLTALPVLEDALLEAGCDQSTILATCRLGPSAAPAQVLWVLELLCDVDPGTFYRAYLGPTGRQLRTLYRLELSLPATEALPPGTVVDAINEALEAETLGSAYMSGGVTIQTDGVNVSQSTRISCAVRGDVERGIVLIRKALAQAPEGTELRLSTPEHRVIELGLGEEQ
jgi:hypothetical protein